MENVYRACNKHVFRILGEKDCMNTKKYIFEYIYITDKDISIYMRFIQFI
jgi:hypothetical protein